MVNLNDFMIMELKTVDRNEKRYVLYDGKEYDTDEKFNRNLQLADMYLNQAIGGEECTIIVLDEPTYKFWFNVILKQQKEKYTAYKNDQGDK